MVGRLLLHTCFLSKAQLRQWILRGFRAFPGFVARQRQRPTTDCLSRSGWMPREEDPVLPGELSIVLLRTVLTGCRACFRLRKKYKAFGIWGSAGSPAGWGSGHMNYLLASMTEMQNCSWRGYQNGPRRRSQHPSSSLMCSRSRCCVPSGNTFLFAACCGDVHFAFLDGACQRESAESNGSNNK